MKTKEEFVNLTSKVANVVLPFMAILVLFCVFFAQDIAKFFAEGYPTNIFKNTFIALSFSFIGVFLVVFLHALIFYLICRKDKLLFLQLC